MTKKFGTLEKPNLDEFSNSLARSLMEYEKLIKQGIRFGNATQVIYSKLTEPLHHIHGKSYLARSEIPVFVDGKKVSSMYAVLFGPGSGTGSQENYKLEQVKIPGEYKFDEMSERVIPRKKDCTFEVILNFFSVYNNRLIPNGVTLEKLSFAEDKKTVKRIGYLGANPEKYSEIIYDTYAIGPAKPSINLTVDRRNGAETGNPHVIYQDPTLKALELVGFLSVKEEDNPLVKILENLISEPVEA